MVYCARYPWSDKRETVIVGWFRNATAFRDYETLPFEERRGRKDHVTICSTCEDQDRADYRIPILLELPIKHRRVASEPMLEEIHIGKYLASGLIEHVVCGGESGPKARPCNYDWILEVRRECIENSVSFTFKQTGAVFIKDGKTYHVERKYQMSQARKAGIDFFG